jgi:hypothetical protein
MGGSGVTSALLVSHHDHQSELWTWGSSMYALAHTRQFPKVAHPTFFCFDGSHSLTLQGTMRACVNSQVKSACPPSKVVGLDEEEITDFGLGWGHGLALTASKKVFSWGWGKNGQLARFAPSLSLCARDIIL